MTDADIIKLLSERKYTRLQLQNLLGLTDRQCRAHIERLRLDGHLIVNDKDGLGYYLAKTKQDAADCMADYYAKFVTMSKVLEAMTEAYKKLT